MKNLVFRKKSYIKLLFLLQAIACCHNHAGIALHTLIQTTSGPRHARDLNVGDTVMCTDMHGSLHSKAILAIEDAEELSYDIILEDDSTLCVSHDQKFFLPEHNTWRMACMLSPDDIFIQQNGNNVKVKKIIQSDKKKLLRFIYVDKYHNFFAGENCVLAHNLVLGVYLAFELACLLKVGAIAGAVALRAYLPDLVEKITGKNIRPALQATESIAGPLYNGYESLQQQSSRKFGFQPHQHERSLPIEPDHYYPLPEGFQPVQLDHPGYITPLEPVRDNGILVFDPYPTPNIQPTGFQPVEIDDTHGIHETPITTLDRDIIIAQNITIQDLINDSQPGKKTHKAHQYIRPPTGFQGANEDFDRLGLSDITYGPRSGMRKGFLPDGRTVSVRAESTEGSPTLEVRGKKNVTAIKFRYPEPGKENEQ